MLGGIVVPIMGRRHFDFSYLAAGGTETEDLASAILVAPFVRAILVARLHVNNIPSGGTGTFTIDAYPTDPSGQDPREFTSGTSDGTLTIAEPVTDPAPKLLTTSISTINGPFWKIQLKGSQPLGSSATLSVQISLDLVLRVNS